MRPAALLLALAPVAAQAEGARFTLDCTDAQGIAAQFTVTPDALDAAGAGRVAIEWPDGMAPGVTASPQGPWAWTDGPAQYALAVDALDAAGRPTLLLHRFVPGSPAATETYTCEAPT